MKLKRSLLILLFFSTANIAFAQIDNYEFKFNQPQERERYLHLISELRCPKCQNQNIADSDAQIAYDLRNKVYELMKKDKTDAQIKNYLVERYGDFILYRPPFNLGNSLLWLLPFLLLLIGFIFLLKLTGFSKGKKSDAKTRS